ncbi:Protein of unknown function [Gryllus bimaculatus]|nr:Protein of unknown function [Gryllus bimaculatus]
MAILGRRFTNMFVVVRIIGMLGLIWSCTKLVHLSLDMVPNGNGKLEKILKGDLRSLWVEDPWTGDSRSHLRQIRPDVSRIRSYYYYILHCAVIYFLMIFATLIMQRWSFALWLLAEVTGVIWQISFFLMENSVEPYEPTFVDSISSIASIGTATYMTCCLSQLRARRWNDLRHH